MAHPTDVYMSEDYVANILKKDAQESRTRYSALGVDALLPKRWVFWHKEYDSA